MIQLDSITLYRLKMPLSKPFRISTGVVTEKEFVLIQGEADGITGWGEAAVDGIPFYTSETAETAMSISKRVLAPFAKSRAWNTPEEFSDALHFSRGHAFTKMMFETMLWDIHGKQTNSSIATLLNEGPPSRTVIDSGPSIGIKDSPEDLIQAVGHELGIGAKRIKIKVKCGHDYAYIKAVREQFPDITLMVDANSDYGPEDIDDLLRWDEFNLLMIEQPLDHDDLYYHAQLAEKMETPICLDESIQTVHLAKCALEMKAADIVNIKVGRVGGLTNTLRIHNLCQEAGIPVWIGSRIGTSIADSVRLAAASLPNVIYPSDAGFATTYMSDDIVKTPVYIENGCQIALPTAPGIGVEVDLDQVEKYTIEKISI